MVTQVRMVCVDAISNLDDTSINDGPFRFHSVEYQYNGFTWPGSTLTIEEDKL